MDWVVGYTLNRHVKLRFWGIRVYRNQLVICGMYLKCHFSIRKAGGKGNDSLIGSRSVLQWSSWMELNIRKWLGSDCEFVSPTPRRMQVRAVIPILDMGEPRDQGQLYWAQSPRKKGSCPGAWLVRSSQDLWNLELLWKCGICLDLEIPNSLPWNPLLTSHHHHCRTSAWVGAAHEKGPGCLQLRWTQCWVHQLPQDARNQLFFLGENLPREALWGSRNLFSHLLLLPHPTPQPSHMHYSECKKIPSKGRESGKCKKALLRGSPERALNWGFQVEKCCHFTTLDQFAIM